jgi:hypothetical protein
MNSLIILIIIIIIILFFIGYRIMEPFAEQTPILNQDPYMSCFLFKDEKSCNNNNKLYNFVGSLSKCTWMNDYCGPVRMS